MGMSTFRPVCIVCDNCFSTTESIEQTVVEARKAAKRQNWTRKTVYAYNDETREVERRRVDICHRQLCQNRW